MKRFQFSFALSDTSTVRRESLLFGVLAKDSVLAEQYDCQQALDILAHVQVNILERTTSYSILFSRYLQTPTQRSSYSSRYLRRFRICAEYKMTSVPLDGLRRSLKGQKLDSGDLVRIILDVFYLFQQIPVAKQMAMMINDRTHGYSKVQNYKCLQTLLLSGAGYQGGY